MDFNIFTNNYLNTIWLNTEFNFNTNNRMIYMFAYTKRHEAFFIEGKTS